MKKLHLILLLCCLSLTGRATTYYSYGTGAATVLSSWWTGTSGTGLNPTTFANPGDIFTVQSALTIATNWTIGTAGTYTSQLQFNTSGSITGSVAVVFTIYGNFVMNDGFYTASSGVTAKDLGVQQSGNVVMSLDNLASGLYMVEITSGKDRVVQRLVKE